MALVEVTECYSAPVRLTTVAHINSVIKLDNTKEYALHQVSVDHTKNS